MIRYFYTTRYWGFINAAAHSRTFLVNYSPSSASTVRPQVNSSLFSTSVRMEVDQWTLGSLALRGIPPQGEILDHSPLWSQRTQRGSSLRTSIHRTARWLALVNIFPGHNSCWVILVLPTNHMTPVPSGLYRFGIQLAQVPGTVRECLIVPTHCTWNNSKNIT